MGALADNRVDKHTPAEPIAGYQKNPNPQGKGVVPVLRDWSTMQAITNGPKTASSFVRDYCISSLVLAAKFRFKPVVGKEYFLYAREEEWMLSLVAPHEWGRREPGAFLGRCCLRPDMTWELETAATGEIEAAALSKAQQFINGFVDTLAGQDSIAEHLPFYASGLPYYQRMLGTALAASLQRSMPAGREDIRALLTDTRALLLTTG